MPIGIVEKEFVFRGESIKIKIKRLNWPEINTLRESNYVSTNIAGVASVTYHAFEAKTNLVKSCLIDAPFKIEDLTPDEGDALHKIVEDVNSLSEKKNTNSGEHSLEAQKTQK